MNGAEQLESHMEKIGPHPSSSTKLIPSGFKTCKSIRRKYIHKNQGKRLTYLIIYKFKILVYIIKNRIQGQVIDWEKYLQYM